MIHYHGLPITPEHDAALIVRGRHVLCSFAYRNQLPELAKVVSSFVLDNGAYTTWKTGRSFETAKYYDWVELWRKHPAFDWCLIPDVIDGGEDENDEQISQFTDCFYGSFGVPVWHLHESLHRLARLSASFERIALGSSGAYATVKSPAWWNRMYEAMEVLCGPTGAPYCQIHGLRMLDSEVFTRFPLKSADSADVALNIGLDVKWSGRTSPREKATRGIILASNIESRQSAERWSVQAIQSGLGLTDAPLLADQ